MNAIYKVIWNDAIRQYQVVNELCRSRRKACSVKAVHTDGTSRGIFHALKVGAMAGTLGLMTLGTPVWADPYPVPEFTWSMGAGQITSGTFEPGIDALPVAGTNDRIVVDLSKVSFTDVAQLIYGQDENSSFAALIGVDRDYMISWDEVPLVFHDANGNETNQFTYGTGFANFKYELGAGWTTLPSGEWVIGLTRRLAEIDLTSTDNWQYIDAGEEKDVDLSAKITGNGNITFGFSATGEAQEGWLTLNSDAETDEFKQVNDYTGVTRVGYTADASESDPTHLVFGMTEAFGDTSMLMVSSNSEVLFGGINSDKAYTQTVGGLSGTGTLDLGSAAHLTLNQSVVQGVTSAPTTDEPGKLGILNNILGTGAANPESGAVLNVVLDGAVKDYEVVFTDQNVTVSDDQVDFSGLITLTNSAVTAYKNGRSDTVGGQEYADVNKILTGATLQLKSNGLLRVDSTGELNNLIISSGAGGIEFSGLGNVDADGQGALMINGDLTFDGADATVSIKDFDYNIGEAAAGMDLIDADDGLLNTLVHVKGDVVGEENYGFVLDEASQQEPVVSAITDDSGTTIASGTWVLEDELRYDGSGNFDLAYKLTQVDIKEDQTLTISGSDKASEASKTQDFTAKITGSGNIVFDAADNATGSGTRIEIGDASTIDKNDYTGSTTVTDGTTLVLTEDDAMGQTSDLIAYGNVEIGDGIEQTVKNINSSGTGTISIDDSGKLTVDASGDQTINNIISGAGDLNIDLGGSGNKLVFGNSGQGSSFTGDLSLGNGRFSLDDGQNEAFAGSSSIILGSGAVFDFGSGTSNIKDLTVNADSKLESSALVIGSDTAPHNISGSFGLNSDTTITLTGVSVETDLSLTDYDGGSVSQDFITAGNVAVGADAEVTLSGSGDFVNLGNLVLDYQQTQNGSAATVAETVWTVNGSLKQNGNAFQVGTQLKEIRLIGNTILSGSGTSNELSALVTDSDKDGSHSLQFSSADGTQTSFTIVDYAGDSVVGNSYTGATTVDSNVTVTLGTNNGFGSTSLLTAQGNVTLSDGVTQTVKGLSGTGTITLGSGAALTLEQTGSASVGNILGGTGEFIVDLGAEANELSFTNSGAGAFGGTVSLSDGTVRLASGTATQTVLSGADLALDTNGRLIVSGSGTDRRELGGLTLKGGSQIDFSSVSMGDANSNNAQLHVSGSFTINGSNDVSVGGINLDGTQNILAADDANGGLKQALVTADGGIDLSSGQLVIDLTDTSMKSEIKNSGSDKTVAYGVWSAGSDNDVFNVEGNTLYAYLRLSEIQLADKTDGLKLNASGLSGDSQLISSGESDKNVWGLDLTSGGTIDFGQIDGSGGQLVLSRNDGTWSGSGRIDLSSNNQTTVVFEDGTSQQTGNRFDELNSGSALLSGGGVFDLTLFEGVSDVYLNGSQITGSGTVSISGFQTDVSFSGTGENYYQDADGDGTADDLVAKLYRGGSGSFYYDADEDVIYMRYGIRQIDLQYSDSGRGLRLAADGNGGELSADVTGSGNIVYAGGNIRVSGSNANDYTGSTYVESGASVTLGKTDAFGKTDYLEIAEGGSVSLDDGLSQVVGELAGGGSLSLGSGSSFTINNSQRQDGEDDPAAKDEIVIETAITAASGSTFVINGSGAATADRRASVNFAQDASLSGANFSLENAQLTFDLSDSGNFSYVSVNDTSKFTLGSNSALLIDARNGSASQNYQLNNTLTLSGGLISFDDVLFTTGGQGNTAILNVGTLDVTDVGYIGVSAAIDDNFNILDADTSHFTQALIHYQNETEGSREKLEAATSDQMDDSAISNATGDTVAYVEWSGGFVDESLSPQNTIVMSYQVAKLKLAQGGDAAGLVLDATGHDSKLSVLITDDEQAGSSGGNITFAGGDILITNTNEYTGVTTVATGSATLGANNGFGNTRLLDVVSGYVNFGGFSQTLGSIDVNSANGISGSGSVTLGSDAYKDLHSVIRGEQSTFSGNVTLTNGHTLELSDTLGIGSSGTVVLESGTRLVINDQSADNTFSKVVTGEEGATVELSGSGFNIYADNTNYLGDWSLTSGTTASVSGSGSVGVDSILGSGGTVALGTDATLALSQDSGSIVVDNVFAGAGTLVVSGTSDQEFGFSTNWTDAETPGFTGTLRLEDGIKMTVGGGSGSGVNNAANLANADFIVGSKSTLFVAQQGSIVDTFDVLNVSGGTISFAGKFDLGATTEELGQLRVGSLTGSGNIALEIPDSSGTVDGTIGQNELLKIDDGSHFQALITAETGTVSESGWTLNDSTTTSGSGLRQAVRNAGDTETVAHAIYDYALATGEANSGNVSNNDSLGIEYTLKTVDIVDTKTLELSDSGSLSAVITDSSGAGTLLITGQIELTGQNEYDSVTRVSSSDASLTVGSSGLGATSSLELSGGATFVNAAGATNSAEKMSSSGSNIVLNEGSELKLTGGENGFLGSNITGGSISGSGTLTVVGSLNVSGSITDGDFTGQIKVDSTDKIFGFAGINFYSTKSGYAGLGTGEVAFSSSGDAVYIFDGESTTGSTTLTNTYTGNGQIKVVNYGSGSLLFDFSANQAEKGNFTGTLLLQDADYHLYEDAGELKNATLMVCPVARTSPSIALAMSAIGRSESLNWLAVSLISAK